MQIAARRAQNTRAPEVVNSYMLQDVGPAPAETNGAGKKSIRTGMRPPVRGHLTDPGKLSNFQYVGQQSLGKPFFDPTKLSLIEPRFPW